MAILRRFSDPYKLNVSLLRNSARCDPIMKSRPARGRVRQKTHQRGTEEGTRLHRQAECTDCHLIGAPREKKMTWHTMRLYAVPRVVVWGDSTAIWNATRKTTPITYLPLSQRASSRPSEPPKREKRWKGLPQGGAFAPCHNEGGSQHRLHEKRRSRWLRTRCSQAHSGDRRENWT